MSNYKVSFADAQHFFFLVNDVIADFNGNAEKFYPTFYKVVGQEGYFNNLTKRCALLVGYELANHVLSHITNSTVKNSFVTVSDVAIKFSDKENGLISYLSGYVFGTFYRRIRHSKVWQGRLGQECLSILMAGKLNESSNPITTTTDIHQKFVDAKNRGGLWNVSSNVTHIFARVELIFRKNTRTFQKTIDSKNLVEELLKGTGVLSDFSNICDIYALKFQMKSR